MYKKILQEKIGTASKVPLYKKKKTLTQIRKERNNARNFQERKTGERRLKTKVWYEMVSKFYHKV